MDYEAAYLDVRRALRKITIMQIEASLAPVKALREARNAYEDAMAAMIAANVK